MDVSIVIVNWNTRELLGKCIRSVYENAGDADCEIIVVDNASSDKSVEMVRCEFPQVAVVSNSVNTGYAAGVNQGLRVACGRYCLVLNSDIIICDGAISKIIDYADEHPKAAVIGPQVWENQEVFQPTCFGYPSLMNMILRMCGLAKIFKNNHFFGREMMLWWKRDTAKKVDVVSGMFMFVRRRAVEQVGVMDESYFLYFEETDWCYRFAKAGWENLFFPGARIIHLDGGNKSTDQVALKMKIQYRRSMLVFFRKNYGPVSYVVARFLLAVDSGARCALWSVLTFLKKLAGKDAVYGLGQRKRHWLTLRFCLFDSDAV